MTERIVWNRLFSCDRDSDAGEWRLVACGGDSAESTSLGERLLVDGSAESDFRRNIEQMAVGASDAKANFADDLVVLGSGILCRRPAEALAQQLSAAMAGKTATPEQVILLAKAVLATAAGSGMARAEFVAIGTTADRAAAAGMVASALAAK
jgi:hypothetical protein